jgi:hypothetical protein
MVDVADYDIMILEERSWNNSALNTEEWRKLLKEAMQDCRANDNDIARWSDNVTFY